TSLIIPLELLSLEFPLYLLSGILLFILDTISLISLISLLTILKLILSYNASLLVLRIPLLFSLFNLEVMFLEVPFLSFSSLRAFIELLDNFFLISLDSLFNCILVLVKLVLASLSLNNLSKRILNGLFGSFDLT